MMPIHRHRRCMGPMEMWLGPTTIGHPKNANWGILSCCQIRYMQRLRPAKLYGLEKGSENIPIPCIYLKDSFSDLFFSDILFSPTTTRMNLCDDVRRHIFKFTHARLPLSRAHVVWAIRRILIQKYISWPDFVFLWSCRRKIAFDEHTLQRIARCRGIRYRQRNSKGTLNWKSALRAYMKKRCMACGVRTCHDVFGV